MKKYSVILICVGVPLFLFATAWGVAFFQKLLPRRNTAGWVSTTQAEMRSIADALEQYCVDRKSYPPSSFDPATQMVPFDEKPKISTFLSTDGKGHFPEFEKRLGGGLYRDAFTPRRPRSHYGYYAYLGKNGYFKGRYSGYVLVSRGPDGDFDLTQKDLEGQESGKNEFWFRFVYDPTNGSLSSGDIIRMGGAVFPDGPREPEDSR